MADSWIYTTLSYGGLEFVTFVLVDAVVKSPLRDAATDGEKRTIWLYESVGLSLICFLVYLLHHMPYLLILLTGITFVYTQLLSRTDLTHIVADLRAHWENHLQHEESMKQLEQQKYLQQQQQALGVPNFPPPGINSLGGQNAEPNYGFSFPFLTKQPALQYPPNATVVPGQDTPMYSLNPSLGMYRDGVRHSRAVYTSYNRSWNNVAATNYAGVDVQHALPAVTNTAYDSSVTTVQNTNSNGRRFLWSDQNLPRRSLHPDISTRALSKPPSSTSSIKSKVMSMVGYGPTTLRPIGLVNYGQNVCFINSVVQCLARGPYLVENLTAIAAKELECSVSESQLLSSLTELLDHLTLPPDESQPKALSVNKFRLACSNLNPQLVTPPGQHMKQQDAAEFLMWLLAVLHGILNKNRRALDADSTDDCGFTSPRLASLKLIYGDLSSNRVQELRNQCRKDIAAANGLENESYAEAIQRLSDLEWLIYKQTNDTLIDSLFTGQLVEAYHDVNHGSISVNLQTFNVLPVPIDYPDSYSGLVMLDDCFARFCHVENISEPSSSTTVLSDQPLTAGVLRNRNLRVKGLGGSPTTPQNFRLAKESGLAGMPSPIHPSMYPGSSMANTFTPQTLPTSPPVQTFLRANPGNDSGFLDNTFKTSTPLGKDSTGSKPQEKIQRRCLLRQLPECLIIQLMRFRYDSLAQRPTKVTTAVSIRLRDFNLRDVIYDNVMHRGDLTVSDSKYVYELYGLCLHLGGDSTSHGHYISYVQDRGRWYRMDDQNVVEVNMEFQLNSEEIRQNAYLLFYRRTV